MSDLTLTPPQTGGAQGPAVGRREEVAALGCLLLVLLADLALLRVGLDAEDEGYFVQQATRVLHGQLPFRDFDSLYTPALLYIHAAVVALLGGSPVTDVRLVGWLARILFVGALYGICRPMVRPRLAMLPSLYTLIALDRVPSTWEPHPGWPSAALSILAIALAVHLPRRRPTLTLLVLGAIGGVVFALKQNAGVLLGLALVVGIAWQGFEPSVMHVTRALRMVQIGLVGLVLVVVAWLIRPHATPLLLAYFLGPPLIAALAATMPVQVSPTGRTVGSWLRAVACLGVGFGVVSVPWLVALLRVLQWNFGLIKSFVGLVNQDPLWFPPAAPPGGGWSSLLGIAFALLALVRFRHHRFAVLGALLSLAVFGACVVVLTRGPDDGLATAVLLAPGRASQGLLLLVPTACMVGGVWLSTRAVSPREAWWLRWMCVASAVTFLTQYPRVDDVHLTWSAGLPLATGAVVLPRVYGELVGRWQAGAGRLFVAVALLLVPLATSLWNLGLRSGGLVNFSDTSALPLQLVPVLTVTDPPAVSGMLVSTHQDATLLAAARFVATHTRPGEPTFVYPTSPLVYVLADRPNPTRFDHLYPGAATPVEVDAVTATLRDTPVNVVVVNESDLAFWGAPLDNAPLETYLASSYREVAEFGEYRVLQRSS